MKLPAATPGCAEIREALLSVEEEEAGQQIQRDGCGPLPTETLSKTTGVLRLFDEPTMPMSIQSRASTSTSSGPITKPTEIKTVR